MQIGKGGGEGGVDEGLVSKLGVRREGRVLSLREAQPNRARELPPDVCVVLLQLALALLLPPARARNSRQPEMCQPHVRKRTESSRRAAATAWGLTLA